MEHIDQETRNNLIEVFNEAAKIYLEIVEDLLNDSEGTLEWMTVRKMQIVNQVIRMTNAGRETLALNFMMLRGAQIILDDIRDELSKDPHAKT